MLSTCRLCGHSSRGFKKKRVMARRHRRENKKVCNEYNEYNSGSQYFFLNYQSCDFQNGRFLEMRVCTELVMAKGDNCGVHTFYKVLL